jgi:hypothetical protein
MPKKNRRLNKLKKKDKKLLSLKKKTLAEKKLLPCHLSSTSISPSLSSLFNFSLIAHLLQLISSHFSTIVTPTTHP